MGQEGSKNATTTTTTPSHTNTNALSPSRRTSAPPPMSPQQMMAKGIRKMDPSLQRKFAAGSAYNMKVVVRGDTATGKTAMLRRLEGGPFLTDHYATPQIQTTTINWNYKITDEVVKVEVWDVVDTAQPKRTIGDDAVAAQMPAADASTINVYQGVHAVVVLVDPTRKWTFEYAQRILKDVPKGVDVLLLMNFRDLESRRVVTREEVEQFMRTQPENVRQMECSLLDCYGLKQVYTFLNLPFLRLKQKSLRQQLEECDLHLTQAEKEADLVFTESYDEYTKNTQTRRASLVHAQTPPPKMTGATSASLLGDATNSKAPAATVAGATTDPLPKKSHRKISSDVVSRDDTARELMEQETKRKAEAATNVDDVLAGFDPGAIVEGDGDDDDGFFSDSPAEDDDDDDDVRIQPVTMPTAAAAAAAEQSSASTAAVAASKKKKQEEEEEDDDDELMDSYESPTRVAGAATASRTPPPINPLLRADVMELSDDDEDALEVPDAPLPQAIVRRLRTPSPQPPQAAAVQNDDQLDMDDDNELNNFMPPPIQTSPATIAVARERAASPPLPKIDAKSLDAFLNDDGDDDDGEEEEEKVVVVEKKEKKKAKKEKKKAKKEKKKKSKHKSSSPEPESSSSTTTTKKTKATKDDNDDDDALDDYEPPGANDDDDDLDGFY